VNWRCAEKPLQVRSDDSGGPAEIASHFTGRGRNWRAHVRGNAKKRRRTAGGASSSTRYSTGSGRGFTARRPIRHRWGRGRHAALPIAVTRFATSRRRPDPRHSAPAVSAVVGGAAVERGLLLGRRRAVRFGGGQSAPPKARQVYRRHSGFSTGAKAGAAAKAAPRKKCRQSSWRLSYAWFVCS